MPNKMERFTQRARRALSLAQEESERFQHHYIGTEHLLLGLMDEAGGVAARALAEVGLERARCEAFIRQAGPSVGRQWGQLDLTRDVKQALELAVDEARRRGHHYIGTEHLLLGLTRHTKGMHTQILKDAGIEGETIRQAVERVLQQPSPASAAPSEIHRVLAAMPGALDAEQRSVRLRLKGADDALKAEFHIPLAQLQLLLLQAYQGSVGQINTWQHGDDSIEVWVE